LQSSPGLLFSRILTHKLFLKSILMQLFPFASVTLCLAA